MVTKRFWDFQATYCPENFFTFQFGHKMFRKLAPYLNGCKTVLDYGCGSGHMIAYLLNHGLRTSGADCSKRNIHSVSQKYEGHEDFEGAYSIDVLKKTGKKFDSIICLEVLEHLDDEQLKSALENFKTLLNEGGRLIITTPNDEDMEKGTIYCPNCNCLFHRWQHVRSWSAYSLTSYLKANGFEIAAICTTDFSVSFKRNRLRAFYYVLNKLRGRPVKKPHIVCIAKLKLIPGASDENSV